jgi:hypothetical protein
VAAIVVMRARRPSRTGRRSSSGLGRRRSISGDLRSSFGPLDRRVTRAVGVLSVIGFLSFITGIIFTFHGGPAGSGGGCAYRLQAHGIYTCVSETTYDLAGAALQRMVAGIFLFFYAMHFYAALASSKAVGGESASWLDQIEAHLNEDQTRLPGCRSFMSHSRGCRPLMKPR